MSAILLGRKIGMTRLFDSSGNNYPVTVIQAGPCFVSQLKNADHDGYSAVQIAFEDLAPRNSTLPTIGHDGKAGLEPKRFHQEFRVTDKELSDFTLGQAITVEAFDGVKFIDVTGTSKGKGFAGTMKRHNFKGLCASHGTERKHRSPGSISGHATNRGWSGRPKRGKRMSGHMGAEQVTIRSLELVGQDKEKNLLLIKGSVPGSTQGLVVIRRAIRLYRSKAKQLAQAS